MPEPIAREFGKYIMPSEPISTVDLYIYSFSKTNIIAYQFAEAKP
jgi:hypothetical protein